MANTDQKSNNRVITNVATDTGGAFEVGNSLIAFPDPLAMTFNLAVAALAYTARAVGERKAEKLHVPNALNWVPANLGTSLMISGAGLAGSAVFKGLSDEWRLTLSPDIDQPVQASAAAILLMFGAANFARGYARGLKPGQMQKLLDATGIVLATMGVMASVPDSLLLAKGLLVTAAVLETSVSAGVKQIPVGLADFTFAGACAVNAFSAFSNGQTLMGIANMIFALAFVSLGALKRHGGFYQMLPNPSQNR